MADEVWPEVRAAQRKTRAGEANAERILDAALNVFAAYGFRGARIDGIAAAAGLSKPNLLYYFRTKEELYTAVLARTLDMWLEPLRELDGAHDPETALRAYIAAKLAYSRSHPAASRLFALEVIRGAPVIRDFLAGELKEWVEARAAVVQAWVDQGRMDPVEPAHLFFAIWAATQTYADFDAQIAAVLGRERQTPADREAATEQLVRLVLRGCGLCRSTNSDVKVYL